MGVEAAAAAGLGRGGGEPSALRWVGAAVERSGTGLRVELECGARMEIADEAQAKLAAVLLRAQAAGGVGC